MVTESSVDNRTKVKSNEMDKDLKYREALATNLLYGNQNHKRSLLRFHDVENSNPFESTKALCQFGRMNSPIVASASYTRHIPTSPTRILDAPELRDDYYLNLVSWGDNNVLAVALDQIVYLYNTDTGSIQEIKACSTRNDYVTSVQWVSQKGRGVRLAIGTFHSELQIWDTTTMTKLRSMRGHEERIGSLSWNGSTLASGSRDSKIINHDLRISQHIVSTFVGHYQEICGLEWSPDGKTLASGGNDNCLCIWDGKMVACVGSPRQKIVEHTAAVKALAWCPWERNLLASGGGTADRTIKFWNTSNGRMLNSVHTGSQVCGLVWSKTEKELLSSHGFSQNELCLWKYPTMVRMREFTGHTARVLHLTMSPDGGSVVSAGADETLRFWNVFSSSKNVRKTAFTKSFLPNAVIR
jgi:cell division cycle protein 20 (cofactor of APC complex)